MQPMNTHRLQLPGWVVDLAEIPAQHRYCDRNTALVEAAIFHGFKPGQIVQLDCRDVDLERHRIRQHGATWLPLRTNHPLCWHALLEGRLADDPLFRGRSDLRLSRIDVWRILHRVGKEADLEGPLHCRRTRDWLGKALSEDHDVSSETLALAFGVRDPRSVSRFRPPPQPKQLPKSAPVRQ
jgi:integrase